MPEIRLLDQGTINKIAAGEVVERPSAVVKELIENAIDAGTTAVTIEIKGGGIDLIRITDNGSGIESQQVRIAFERHATSKIRSAEDLLSVSSLGFRGEALASIGAVAQVELMTKTRGELTGTRYVIHGGEEQSFENVGCPEGTTFVIRNLFYNVPARRKFLKSAQTESSYVNDLVERMAISNPNISFKFINNNQLKLQTSGNGNVKDVLYHVFGRDITSNLVPLKENSPVIGIEGFVAKPVVNRGNRNYMNYFINGRYIKSSIINKAIEEAYKPYMMQHRYPMTALSFTIDSHFIDVNVHPAKMEIRFTNGQQVFHDVFHAVSDALAGKNMIPSVTLGKEEKKAKVETEQSKTRTPEPFERKRAENETGSVGKQFVEAAKVISKFEEIKKQQEKLKEERTFAKEQKESSSLEEAKKKASDNLERFLNGSFGEKADKTQEKEKNWETIEKINETTESDSQPIIEKSKDENHTQSMTNTEIKQAESNEKQQEETVIWDKTNSSQEQLFQTKEEASMLTKDAKKHHKIIGQVFDTYWIVQYEDQMFMIDQHAAHEKVLFERTMKQLEEKNIASQMLQPPIILSLSMREEQALKKHKEQLERLGFEIDAFGGREFSVRAVPANLYGVAQTELLTELLDEMAEEIDVKKSDIILEKVASMSCKAAIKGNMKMSYKEAEALIDDLMELENPYHCPHGRPVIVSMTKYEIEKKFKRIV